MNRNPNQLRIARLSFECDVSCVPARLLLAGCAALVLVLALDDVQSEGRLREQSCPDAQAAAANLSSSSSIHLHTKRS